MIPVPRVPLAAHLACGALSLVLAGAVCADPQTAVFDAPISAHEWTLAQLNPALPSDWDGYDFLVLELRTSSSQRFELGLRTPHGLISKKVHPFPGVMASGLDPA